MMAAAKGNDYTLKRKVSPQYTQEQLQEIAEDLLDYAENSKSIHLAPWCRKKGFCLSWLNKLADYHPIIKDAHNQAKELLGGKVLNSSFYGEGNATVGMAYLPIYDKDFKDLKEWLAKLNKTQDKGETFSMQDLLKLAQAGTLLKAMTQADEKEKD